MKKVKSFISNNVSLVGLLLVIIIGALISSTFLSLENIRNVTRSASITGFIAMGMTFVILCGSIDLSVGAVFSLAGYFFITLANTSPILAIVVPIVVGLFIGLINGTLITKLGIPSFMATLSMMLLTRGVVLMCSGETTIKGSLSTGMEFLGRGVIADVLSVPLILFVIGIFLTSYILKRRAIGRAMYTVGGNAEAAKMMGVSVTRTMIVAHMICGALAGVAGILFASRVGSASPLAGSGYEMYAIAAAVIGGADLNGGKGKMSGTFVGALIIGSFTNIFTLQNILDPVWENVVIGAILLIVVVAQSVTQLFGTRKKVKVEY